MNRLGCAAVTTIVLIFSNLIPALAGDGKNVEPASRHDFGQFLVRVLRPRAASVFRTAWNQSAVGHKLFEAAVLIIATPEGRYEAVLPGNTNEIRQVTLRVPPGTIAVFHTHPNRFSPFPSRADQRVAEKLGVPVATMTIKGLFLYEPATKRTIKVMDGLDWLRPENWGVKNTGELEMVAQADSGRTIQTSSSAPD